MPNAFDPYREALVVERVTLWSPEAKQAAADWGDAERKRLPSKLHASPESAASLEYVRVHTGFCRQITVQTEDVDRLASRPSAS